MFCQLPFRGYELQILMGNHRPSPTALRIHGENDALSDQSNISTNPVIHALATHLFFSATGTWLNGVANRRNGKGFQRIDNQVLVPVPL